MRFVDVDSSSTAEFGFTRRASQRRKEEERRKEGTEGAASHFRCPATTPQSRAEQSRADSQTDDYLGNHLFSPKRRKTERSTIEREVDRSAHCAVGRHAMITLCRRSGCYSGGCKEENGLQSQIEPFKWTKRISL